MKCRLLAAMILAVASTAAASTVVVVDTSRSLSAGELASTAERLRADLAQLPAGTTVGILGVDDRPHWIAPAESHPAEAAATLERLAPGGRNTVLFDALFAALRALPEGGTILLVSDGRDEGSATTLEDVAGRATDLGVRLVTARQGVTVDERVLRRLALLTDGDYVGDLATVEPPRLAALLAPPPAAVADPEPTVAPPPRPTAPAAAPPGRWALVAVVAAVAAALAATIAVWLVVSRRTAPVRRCDDCGATLEEWESECAACQIRMLEEEMLRASVRPAEGAGAATVRVGLAPVLMVRERGGAGRLVHLPPDAVSTVGRAPEVNSLVVRDPAVSARHFKLTPTGEGDWYLVDRDTTNGTTVNGRRVRVAKLQSGDTIQAGTTVFTFELKMRKVG